MIYLNLDEALSLGHLVTGIALDHPLPDGNKRLAWTSLVMFCDRNGYELQVDTSQAVACIVELAAGNVSEAELSQWIQNRAKGFR